MLEEYMCLGGNEIANNARTYGYATTADCPLAWFRCAPCSTLHDAVSDWVPAEYRWTDTRYNLHTNPSVGTNTTGYTGAAATITRQTTGGYVGTSFGRAVSTSLNAAFAANGTASTTLNVVAGDVYTLSAYVRGTTTRRIQLRATWSSGTTVGTAVFLTADWARISETFTVPAGVTTMRPDLLVPTDTGPVGDILEWDAFLIEKTSTLGTYFDGSTVGADGLSRGVWQGTAENSASTLQVYTLSTEGYSMEPPYEWVNIERAVWYDADKAELTSRFYGPWIISVTGIDDSTRTASVTESILDGGVVGLVRHASRQVTVTALLPAEGRDALEYGLSWLDAALAADGCSSHGSSCGAVDMTFLSACPDPVVPDEIVLDSSALTRHLHNVTVTSGPLVVDYLQANNGRHVAYIVEWTMVAGTPFVFGETREVEVQPSVPVVIQDVPYNLSPYPSAELAGTATTVSTNYSTNPSLETNATGWSAGGAVVTPAPTGARSTELAASGTASFKVSVTTTNTSTNGNIFGWHDITLPGGTGNRFSATAWAAAFVVSGTAVLASTQFNIEWRDASTTLRTDVIGTGALNGAPISAKSIVPPVGAITARFVVMANVTSWNTGAVLNLFADAVALTLP